MSSTTINLNRSYFTTEITKSFIKDFQIACKTMEADLFETLFVKYELIEVEDYKDVLQLIIQIMNSWRNLDYSTRLINVTSFDSKCLFCNIGKKVIVYKWDYKHTASPSPMNRVVYSKQIAFFFDYDGHQLIEFGVCNGYLDKNVMNLLKT